MAISLLFSFEKYKENAQAIAHRLELIVNWPTIQFSGSGSRFMFQSKLEDIEGQILYDKKSGLSQ